jgi:hypothetical protein
VFKVIVIHIYIYIYIYSVTRMILFKHSIFLFDGSNQASILFVTYNVAKINLLRMD